MRNRYLIVLLFLLKNFVIFGQQQPVELYIPNTSVLLGDTTTIEVRVNNFTDIISMQASINWNPAELAYLDIADFGLGDFTSNNFGITKADQGHIRFVWAPSNAIAQSLPDSSILFTVRFKCLGSEPYDVTLDFEDKISTPSFPVEFANSSYELLTVQTYPGNIHYYEIITGLEDVNVASLIYPNPFRESFNIRNEGEEIDYIKVFDHSGQLVTEINQPNDGLIRVPVESRSAGIFIVYLKIQDKVFTKKLMKKLYP